MSKFIDKLERIYRTSAPALGFRKATEETALPPVALVADLTRATVKKAKSIADSGIDAAVIGGENIDVGSFKELSKGTGSVPLGLLIEESSDPDKIREVLSLDWDFMVFGLQTPFEVVNKEGTGKILRIKPSLAPTLIRAINELSFSIDAVLIAVNNSTVTIEQLLTCQLFASLLNKPLLANISSSVTSNELSNLHGAGVKGLILQEGTALKVFTELKKTITSLPKTIKRKTGTGVLLPRIGIPTETSAEKVEEEEDDEDI